MANLSLPHGQSAFLRRTRHRVWALIAVCLLARAADAALGLHLIEPIELPADSHLSTPQSQKDIPS